MRTEISPAEIKDIDINKWEIIKDIQEDMNTGNQVTKFYKEKKKNAPVSIPKR